MPLIVIHGPLSCGTATGIGGARGPARLGSRGIMTGSSEARPLAACPAALACHSARPSWSRSSLSWAWRVCSMAAESATDFQARRAGLLGFLVWATQEQDAGLGSALSDWASDEDQRLPAMVEANRVMRAAGADWRNRQVLNELNPPSVLAEGGEHAPVLGLPAEVEPWLRVGDLILGVWREGRFEAAALVPRETIPQAQEQAGDPADEADAES